uniref:Uncharacterized protein n=1 Tax=Arundo donax TaxID=35708 RepID=A0A0A9DUT1_ARUDO
MARSWRRTKRTATPSSHVGARAGPESGMRLLRTLDWTWLPKAQYPVIDARKNVNTMTE